MVSLNRVYINNFEAFDKWVLLLEKIYNIKISYSNFEATMNKYSAYVDRLSLLAGFPHC